MNQNILVPHTIQQNVGRNERYNIFLRCIEEDDLEGLKACDVFDLAGKLDNLNRSPLYLAIQANHFRIVEYLLRFYPSNVDIASRGFRTPLSLAVSENQIRTVELLLKYDVDIDCRDLLERTPLHIAAYHGHIEIVKALLEVGANPNVMDKRGGTPFDDATSKEIQSLLAEYATKKAVKGLNVEANIQDSTDFDEPIPSTSYALSPPKMVAKPNSTRSRSPLLRQRSIKLTIPKLKPVNQASIPRAKEVLIHFMYKNYIVDQGTLLNQTEKNL